MKNDPIPHPTTGQNQLLEFTVTIVSAYLSNNTLPPEDIGPLIESIHNTLREYNGKPTSIAPLPNFASHDVVKSSVTPDYLICLEDGKKLKMLKRYLKTNYGMTPEAYRKKWGLPADYPMVAPRYAAIRSQLAKNIGLGRKDMVKATA